MSDPYIGEIKIFGFNYTPQGYSKCQGQTIQISQNNALYAVLGIAFGGNGTSTFLLPDLQSRVVIGQGQGAGLSPYVFASHAGVETTQLGYTNLPPNIPASYTAPTFVSPTYTPPTYTAPTYTPPTYTQPTAATTINAFTAPTARQNPPTGALLTAGQDTVSTAVVSNYSTAGNPTTLGTGAATTVLSGGGISGGSLSGGGLSGGGLSGGGLSGGGVTVNPNGAAAPFSKVQPYLTLNYVIATAGIFPVRS